jgi:hypothetical protein
MAAISNKDRDVFKDAEAQFLDNFTDAEISDIHGMAERLKAILDAAKKRYMEGITKPGRG